MNAKDRLILTSASFLLSQVPMGQTGMGTRSASVKGLVGAAKDLFVARRFMNSIISDLCFAEYAEAAQELEAFQEWFHERESKDWE